MFESNDRFWTLRPDLILPTPAILAVLNLEKAGHTLTLDETAETILIEPAKGVTVDAHDLAELKRWKQHAILFMQYVPADITTASATSINVTAPTQTAVA